MKLWAVYLIAISIIACTLTAADKRLAKHKLWRIPEKWLFFIAAVGGSGAMYAAMLAIRHKTRHKRFMIGLPLIMVVQAAVVLLVKFSAQQ